MMKKNTKKAMTAKSRVKQVVYDKFSTYAQDHGGKTLGAVDAINCTTADGTIKAGFGIEVYMTPNDEEFPYNAQEPKAYINKYNASLGCEMMTVLTFEGPAYYLDEDDLSVTYYRHYLSPMEDYSVTFEDGRKLLVIVGREGMYYCYDNKEEKISLKKILAGTVCQGRVFVLSQDGKLYYSAPYNYLDFSETVDDGGVITLNDVQGGTKGIITLHDSVYIFCGYGILRVEIAGAARDFKIAQIPYGGKQIIEASMEAFGDKILFLAEDGCWLCDGKRSWRAYEKLGIKINPYSREIGRAVSGGKMIFRYQDTGGVDRTAVLYPDGEYGYVCTCFKGIGYWYNKLLCLYDNRFYEVKEDTVMPSSESRYFDTMDLDFGVQGKKTLKALHFEGVRSLAVDVYVDGVRKIEKAFARFENGQAHLKIDLRGEKFALRFWVMTGSEIRNMTADLEYLE